MNQALLWGIGMVTLAGILQGSFAAPMKRMPAWRWENSWLLFALSGLIIFPWIVNFATVPNVTECLRRSVPVRSHQGAPVWTAVGRGLHIVWPGHQPRGNGAWIRADPGHNVFVWFPDPDGDSSLRATSGETRAVPNRRHCGHGVGSRLSRARRARSRTRLGNGQRCALRVRVRFSALYIFRNLFLDDELQFRLRR